jgi:hypothetical protein
MTTPKPIEQSTDADLRGSWPALMRAAQRARALAIQTDTAIVVCRNGVIEHIRPQLEATGSRVQEPPAPYGDKS